MTTPPLDLEAMADEIARRFCASLSGKRIILSALRELANERDKLWSGQVDKKDAEIARLTQMGCDMETERDMANAHAADLTELVEKWNQWADHMPSCSKYVYECGNGPESGCSCGLDQLLNESNEKEGGV